MAEGQSYQALTPGNKQWLDDCRRWVAESFEGADDYTDSPATKLRVVEAFLQHVRAGETWKLQALGVVFGDALSVAFGFQWVQVPEGLDAIPALLVRPEPDAIIAYPVTMISKRVEAGVVPDYLMLVELAETVARSAR